MLLRSIFCHQLFTVNVEFVDKFFDGLRVVRTHELHVLFLVQIFFLLLHVHQNRVDWLVIRVESLQKRICLQSALPRKIMRFGLLIFDGALFAVVVTSLLWFKLWQRAPHLVDSFADRSNDFGISSASSLTITLIGAEDLACNRLFGCKFLQLSQCLLFGYKGLVGCKKLFDLRPFLLCYLLC